MSTDEQDLEEFYTLVGKTDRPAAKRYCKRCVKLMMTVYNRSVAEGGGIAGVITPFKRSSLCGPCKKVYDLASATVVRAKRRAEQQLLIKKSHNG